MRRLGPDLPAVLLACCFCALLAGGCGDDASAGGGRAEVDVVATTAVAADLVRAAGGGRVHVSALMAPNADPHDYEPRPRDIGALGEADLVVRSGGDLDGWLTDALESAGGAAESLTLMDSVDAAGDDPHWWHDPRNAQKAVAAIGAKLAELDPAGRATYERGAAAYVAQLDDLDGAIERCIGAIPAERRKLVTSHDALGYYARRYDLEVIGTVIASLSTSGQASAGEAAALVETIREAGVPVIFAETSVNPKVEQAIAREAGARMGDPLFADGLGPAGSKGATYLDAMRSNTLAIARGLGGQAAGCDLGG